MFEAIAENLNRTGHESMAKKMKKDNADSELNKILDCIHDRVLILDGKADVLLLNKAFKEFYSDGTDEITGRSIKAIDDERYFKLSRAIILKCIESKKNESLIHETGDKDQRVLITGTPLMKDGEIDRLIIIERDLLFRQQADDEPGKNHRSIKNADAPVYKSKAMEDAFMLALKIAEKDITVLIQGESGTGKEVVAKYIYKNSRRRDKPFVKINCSAIPENLLESELFGYEKGAFTGANESGKLGLFERANGGTLFLDEIGYLPAQMQLKLLRAIQEREIMRIGGNAYLPLDIRIIAATNINLKEATEKGEFRSDLYYRINVVPITLEPLRKRKMDIYPLTNHFLKEFNSKYNKKKTIDESGWRAMMKYQWPGNVRELENLIECLIITTETDVINGEQISELFIDFELEENFEYIPGRGLKSKVSEYEKRLIISQMPYYNGTQDLADALRIDKSTLTRKMIRYNIKSKLRD